MSVVKVKFGAEDAGLSATIGKLNSSLDKIDANAKLATSSLGNIFAGSFLGTATANMLTKGLDVAMRGVTAAADSMKAALDLGGELNDLSTRTGETAGNLLILQRAFTNNGMQADEVGQSINKLQKFMMEASIGAESQTETMARLGITMGDLSGKTPTEQMRVFAERISSLGDPTERAGLSMEIFGKSGGKLLPVLSNLSGEIDTAKKQLGGMPGIMDRSAATFDAVSDNLAVLKGKLIEVAAGFLEKAAPALKEFTDMLTGFDAAGWGQRLMASITKVAQFMMTAFKNPKDVIEILGMELILIAMKFGNAMINKIQYFAEVGQKTINFLADDGFKAFQTAFKSSFDLFVLYGQLAIESLRTSSVMNKFAATINALWDTEVNGANFYDAFNKYEKAGRAANDEVMMDLNQKIKDTARTYEDGLYSSTKRIADEWGKIKGSTKEMNTDFLEAESLSKSIEEKFGEISKKSTQLPNMAQQASNHLQNGAQAMEQSVKKVKQELGLIEQITNKINAAANKNAIDRGGKIEKQIEAEIARGNFRAAARLRDKLSVNTIEAQMRGTGEDRDRRNITDIAKAEGIDTFGKTREELRAEIMAKRQAGLKPENKGLNKQQVEAQKNQAKTDPVDSLTKIVDKIHALVAKIEPKLPQHALN